MAFEGLKNRLASLYVKPRQAVANAVNKVRQGSLGAVKQVAQPGLVKQYIRGQVAQPARQGVRQLREPGLTNKVIGSLQLAGAAYSLTPQGALTNVGQGVVSGGLRALRTGQNLRTSVSEAVTKPTSFAQEGLGVKNTALALGVDILTADPRAFLRFSPKAIAKGTAPISTYSKAVAKHKEGILDIIRRYNTTKYTNDPNRFMEADKFLREDAVFVWKEIFGKNKKVPKDLGHVVAEIFDAYSGVQTENAMRKAGVVLGFAETTGPATQKAVTGPVSKLDEAIMLGRKAREGKRYGITIDKARTEFLDRLTPVFDLVRKAGKELPAELNPYKRMRLIAGLGGKVQTFLERGLSPVLRREAHRIDDLSKMLILDRMEEISSHNKKTFLSADERLQELNSIRSKYTPEEFEQLQQSAQEVRNYADTLLGMLKDSGIIDEKSYSAIKAKNQRYVPFQIVDFISENVEANRFNKTSFNVATQNVIKRLEGSERAVSDPLESLVERTARVLSLVERNNALRSLVDLRKFDSDTFGELITPIRTAGDVQARNIKTTKSGETEVISLFKDGITEQYKIPVDVASAIKNLDAQSSNILVDLLRPQATLLRLGATGLNLPFILANPIRDFADAIFGEITERGVRSATQLLASYPAAIASILKKDDLYRQWASAGGRQATFTSQILGQPRTTIKQLAGTESKLRKLSPIGAVQFLNSVMEESTRLARFKAGFDRGESLAEAAFRSRDITVDFAKSGNSLRILNQIIPFLNANVQGTERMFRIFKNNPGGAAIATGVLSGFPATMLYLYNRQFMDYKDIPQWEKDQNWIIIARDRSEVERLEGEPIAGIKIPKGRIAGIPANITESFLGFVEDNDPNALLQLAVRTIENLSPVGFPVGRQGLLRTASNLTPPLLRAGIEAGTNTSFFTGRPIVPRRLEGVAPQEQYREQTPDLFRAFGRIGVSPLKAEQFSRSIAGGLGQTVADLASFRFPVSGVVGRFGEIKSGSEVDKMFERVAKISESSRTDSLRRRREAEKVYLELRSKPRDRAAREFDSLIEDNPRLAEEINEIIEEEALGLTALDRSVKSLPVKDGSRAKFVFSRLSEMKTNEEKAELWDEYVNKGIITEEVANQLELLFKS